MEKTQRKLWNMKMRNKVVWVEFIKEFHPRFIFLDILFAWLIVVQAEFHAH